MRLVSILAATVAAGALVGPAAAQAPAVPAATPRSRPARPRRSGRCLSRAATNKYYVAYSLMLEAHETRKAARDQVAPVKR